MKTTLNLFIVIMFTFFMSNVNAQDSIVKVPENRCSIFFGDSESGGNCSQTANTLTVRCNSDSLTSDYRIISFGLNIEKLNKAYHATGSHLTKEMQITMQSLNHGDSITFLLKVKGSDGVIRSLSCPFKIE